MRDPDLEAKVRDFLAQRRIAIVGVSRHQKSHPVGSAIYRRLKGAGHEVFAVNPQMSAFDGEPCFPSVGSIPGGVDGVVIATRPEIAEEIARDCVASGVRRVWMHQSFARGSSVSPSAVAFCREHGLSVIAGACPMMYGDGVDFGHRCLRWMVRLGLGQGKAG
jgi:predicted CoA-binding protein